MNTEILQQTGLNKSEVKVYLTLLELGSSTTGPIMDHAKVSSSKIYGVMSRLMEKGLVSSMIKSKTKYYQASSPESLLNYVDEKANELNKQKEQIKKLIPELKLKQKLSENKQEAQVYLGWKGIINAFSFMLESLKQGEDYIAFAQTSREEESKHVKLFFAQYQHKREQKKLHVKLIADMPQKNVFNSEPYSKFKNFDVKYIGNCPPGIVISQNHIFVSTFEPSPVGVVISSKEIADSFRKYFYKEWERAKN
ncbi:hypothetical protein HYX06_01220 [Candidatus Woesearchaeota archaeon]|nr:hypothetical protein [Candidatus Woesearchaeota archaeon]